MIKILQIVGARPNFMKVAPLHRAFSNEKNAISKIVHTGQHFDQQMSDIFFHQLELPEPDYYLGVGSGTHSQMTAEMMTKFEPILLQEKPDFVVVVGDVTSTFACALTAKRNNFKVAHVEAGLRSFDRTMPEEINRILTDQISDLLFLTESSARNNLLNENVDDSKIYFTGNCMIDSLIYYLPKIEKSNILLTLGVGPQNYILVTMHRPGNVDSREGLEKIIKILDRLSKDIPIVFPMHPRTKKNLQHFDLFHKIQSNQNIHITDPLGYLEFIHLMHHSKLIMTDSGGVQEESTYLKVPCLTFRKSTERPITIEKGTNQLLDDLEVDTAIAAAQKCLSGNSITGIIPELWDGIAANRIVKIMMSHA